MRPLISILLLLLFAAPATAIGGDYYIGPEEGVDLHLRPDNSATVSDHLKQNEEVEIIDRERNWAKVRTTDYRGIKGWVPAGAVRKNLNTASSGKSSSSSFFSSFASLFRSSEAPQKTAVLGVRGLEGGDGDAAGKKAGAAAIKTVQWMDSLHVSQSEVSAFIKEGRLKP